MTKPEDTKPRKPVPRNAQGEQIMSTGETFSQWSDRLAEALVANLNAKTKNPEDPDRSPDDKNALTP
jgi:hypothetical protein